MCSVTPETLVWLALLVPDDAEELADAEEAEDAEDGEEAEGAGDEQAATPSAARQAAAATGKVKRPAGLPRRFVLIIVVLPW
jgi:hypothetical protein